MVPFSKMNGAGNDFIVIDDRFSRFSDEELSALAQRYCPRRTGVGADGLLALALPDAEGAHYRMRYHNADGSHGMMCGNGARCLARFARRAGLNADPLIFDTESGRYQVYVPEAEEAEVCLHVPPPERFRTVTLNENDIRGQMFGIWTGTDHAVRFVDTVESVELDKLGPAVRHDSAFAPGGANVNVVEVEDGGGSVASREATLRVRTFEKGVEAETLACGTGALAAALTAQLAGHIQATCINVEMPGGRLRIGFQVDDDAKGVDGITSVTLEGPADLVYQGTLEVKSEM